MKNKERYQNNNRNKLFAAMVMLLVSAIMVVSTAYAWFTLSTAPEVKGITTTVSANGNLEIALCPAAGVAGIDSIASEIGDSTKTMTLRNRTWGNLLDLSDSSYHLADIQLLPAQLNTAGLTINPLKVPVYGTDGRVEMLSDSTGIGGRKVVEDSVVNFAVDGDYGVRAVGSLDGTATELETLYAYVVDFAFQTNAADTMLELQTEAAQRIYAEGSNEATKGSGSTMTFEGTTMDETVVQNLLGAIRVVFFDTENGTLYGIAMLDGITSQVITEATDTTPAEKSYTGELYLYEYTPELTGKITMGAKKDSAALCELQPNQAKAISALVYLDGDYVDNNDVSTDAASLTGTLNLQFASSGALTPAVDSGLKNGNE